MDHPIADRSPLTRRDFLALAAAASAIAPGFEIGTAWGQAPPVKPPVGPATKPGVKKVDPVKAAKKVAELKERATFFRTGRVPRLKIEIPAAGIETLRANPREYVEAKVTEDGKAVYEGVGIHLRGSAGSFRPIDDPKPGFTLNMDKFKDGQHFHGMDKFHLNNSVQDPTYLSEMLCGELYRAVEVPAAQFTHALVMVNDVPRGLYALKEGYDGGFLVSHFKTKEGNFYDGGFCTDIDTELKVDAGKDDVTPRADMQALFAATQEADLAKRFAAMSKVLDVPKFVSYLCLQILTCDWDGYPLKTNNYRIFHHPVTSKFIFIPSGMDQTFDQTQLPLVPTELKGIVAVKLMETPEGRKLYFTRMMDLLRRVFPVVRMMGWLDAMAPKLQGVLKPLDAALANDLPNHVRQLRDSVKGRAASIEEQLRTAK